MAFICHGARTGRAECTDPGVSGKTELTASAPKVNRFFRFPCDATRPSVELAIGLARPDGLCQDIGQTDQVRHRVCRAPSDPAFRPGD